MYESIEVLRTAVATLPGVLRSFSDEQASQRPAPDRWTKKQVIGHLIDSASNNHQRFVRAALAGAVDYPGYDQNRWVDLQRYQQVSWDQLIALWTALNRHLLHIWQQLTPDQWAARCAGGDRGTCTLAQLAERYIAHLHQHLQKMLGAWPPPASHAPDRPTEIRTVLRAQYRAALAMLQQAIERCPDSLWLSSAGHDCPYWQIAFHALFFTHFYLQQDHASMARWPKHRGQIQELERVDPSKQSAVVPYTKAEILEYLDFVREMLAKSLDAMDLASPDCGFPWYTQGKLEHQLNNIRHLQHHAAQLGDRLRSATAQGLDWTLGPV